MPKKLCRETAGAVECEDKNCRNCGWHAEEAERRVEFIRKNGLCRIAETGDDNICRTLFVFRINEETHKYVMPSSSDKSAWREFNANFNPDRAAAELRKEKQN